MRHRIRPIAMNLQPRDRFRKRRTVEKAALCARRCVDVDQPRLQREDLLQSLDVAAGNRQQPEFHPPFERIGREALTPADEAERLEQRAGEDRVGQRVGRIHEAGAITVERGHGSCESLAMPLRAPA